MEKIDDNEVAPQSKGDYMRAVQEMDSRIKEIDSAIPAQMSRVSRETGINPTMLVMVYWKDGGQEVINIAAHWAILINNKKEKK